MSEALAFPLLPRKRVAGLAFGTMRSRARGPGLDLAGARPYVTGDDVRRIDWRASARLSSVTGDDEFVVREHLAEEAARVVVVADGSPSMALYPPDLPWLCKPAAVAEAAAMIFESALQAGCRAGYLDAAGTPAPLSASLAALADPERRLPPGSFVFLLSDFLDFPPGEAWAGALDRGLDLVPVVIQDPVWEQSFPEVAGAALPLAEPARCRAAPVLLTRAEVRRRREENEARFRRILERLDAMGLDSAVLSSHDRGHVLGAFLDWAADRHRGARLAR